MIPISLQGRTALATGAGGSLGRGMALRLAQVGACDAAYGHYRRNCAYDSFLRL